jgi:membrane-bound metal-dependent hydrolase YbcI (DUF457 family)
MFLGHFGAGFGAKAIAPRVSLGWLFVAAQFIDLLWPTLLLAGVERVRIEPGATAVTPLVFEHYPVSHSLAAVAAWAVLVGAIYLAAKKDRRGALVLAALVVSHWLLDALVHAPDLPLYPGSATMAGLGAWSSLPLTLAIELPVFALGAWLYARSTRPLDATGRWAFAGLVAFLLAIQAGNLLGPPPPGVKAIAWVGQAQWLLVLWAFWIDNHRRPNPPP